MRDNFHSRMVAWLKVLLPLAALAILSLLFLIARTVDPESAIPYARVDIEDRLRQPRLTMPTWSGVTDDGSALTVRADVARPGGASSGASAEVLAVTLRTPGGGGADLRAATGQLDQAQKVLTIGGGVEITTSSGYHVTTDAMVAALDRTRLESTAPILATGPMGRINADRMLITRATSPEGDYVLHFTGGVKLIYAPPK